MLQHLDVGDNYDKYRNLAEEVDAWRLGDALGDDLKQAIGVRDDRPSYRDWKALTKGKWFQTRSSNSQGARQRVRTIRTHPLGRRQDQP